MLDRRLGERAASPVEAAKSMRTTRVKRAAQPALWYTASTKLDGIDCLSVKAIRVRMVAMLIGLSCSTSSDCAHEDLAVEETEPRRPTNQKQEQDLDYDYD